MIISIRRTAVTALAALAAAGLSLATASTAAAATPGFLAPGDMPPHATSPWYAGSVTKGLPDPPPFCVGGTLPASGTVYRSYWTEMDAGGGQYTVTASSAAGAKKLAAKLRAAVRDCAAAFEQQYPDGEAAYKSFGKVDVQEGAYVYGVHTNHTEVGAQDIHLFGVGRDGRDVTVVVWGQMGDFGDARVADFRKTTRTAVEKLR